MVILCFTALRFVHLEADFPAREAHYGDIYTDEGAYTNAAVSWLLTGHWYNPGDFNPLVAIPVFPGCQILALKLLGLSLQSARLVSLTFWVLTLSLTYALIRAFLNPRAALFALWLISLNYLVFIYGRLALLETPMTFFMLLSLALAFLYQRARYSWLLPLLALSFTLALLSKSYAIIMGPLLIILLWQNGQNWKNKLLHGGIFIGSTIIFLTLYYLLLVKPYFVDFQYYYSTNLTTRTQANFFSLLRGLAKAIYYGKSLDPLLFPMMGCAAIFFFIKTTLWKKYPLVWISALWIVLYLILIGSQNYVPPRYYLNLIVPGAILAGFMADYLLAKSRRSRLAFAFITLIVLASAYNGIKIIQVLRAPEYSWITMSVDLKKTITAEGLSRPVLLGHFANSISLATGIFSVNDQHATATLEARIKRYHPTHYVSLGSIKKDVQSTLQLYYQITELKRYDVYHNYLTGEPIILYRLIPVAESQL